jgi:hypothetical protein
MPAVPKVKAYVPADIRAEFNARLVESNFLNLDSHVEWLAERLAVANITPPEEIGRNAVYGYMKDFRAEFEASMREGDQMLNIARAAMQTNQDADAILQQASIRTMQTALLRISTALRKLEQEEDPDIPLIAKTAGLISKAMADLGRVNLSTIQHQAEREKAIRAEERAKAADQAATIARRGGLSADAVEQLRREILGIAA